jgi:murein DD-endopeptidase MepM/ murein hydrolase activator NlpD
MKRKKEKTTILFVNKNPQVLKPIQVATGVILHWKKLFAGFIALFISLAAALVYLILVNNQQKVITTALSLKIHSMHHTVVSPNDTTGLREKFTKIDTELSAINGYLKARGIRTNISGAEGGEADHDVLSADEISDFYIKYLDRIGYNISYTPLGFPYPGKITSTFGHRENPFDGSGVETHKGLDISGPIGSPVKAMAKGQVEFAGEKGGFGNCIILKHGNGFETLYGHLSKILVKVGQSVSIGEEIGRIGSTGRSTGPHLHYEIHKNGKKINPQSFLTLK